MRGDFDVEAKLMHIPKETRRVINSFQVMSYYRDLPWSLLTFLDVNVYLFYSTIYDVLLRAVPFGIKKSYPQWFDRGLVELLKEKNRLYSTYCDTRSASD